MGDVVAIELSIEGTFRGPMETPAGDSGAGNGPLSSTLATMFRGKLCDVVLWNRSVTTIEKDQVIYDVGDENQTFFFVQRGFVKVGSVTEDGQELIYDVRKAGDIVGELCASGQLRRDCAVALERTQVIAVPLGEVLDIVQKNRHLLQELVQICCESLSDAYDQLNTLAFSDTVHRLATFWCKMRVPQSQSDLVERVGRVCHREFAL
jgi:CRP-like cAMP-binding protein